jgi:shikimate 5-dehydrogenase
MKTLLIALICLSFASCSIESRTKRKISRAERKIEKLTIKYPQLLKSDTIHEKIEIITPAVKLDTIHRVVYGDTVYLDKDRLKVKYIIQNDTILLSAECASDTIYKEVSIPFQQIVVKKRSILDRIGSGFKSLIYLLILLFLCWLGFKAIIKFIKPI